MEKINILMATYNGRRYVAKQVESILNQTYTDFRLIISDDGSTDSTVKILEEYEKKDSRVEIYAQQENHGVVANFEFLISKVRAEFFMFADQDDIWEPNKIEDSMRLMQTQNLDLVYTDLTVVDSRMKVLAPSYWKQKGLDYRIKKYNNFESLYLNNFVTGCTMLVKSKWINEFMPLPKTSNYVLHDYWVALAISRKGKIGYLDKQTVKYRQHPGNKVGASTVSESFDTLKEVRDLFIKVKLEHFDTFKKNDQIFNKKYRELNRAAFDYFEYLEDIKSFTFRGLGLFFELYKYESFSYKMKNLAILHFPAIANMRFKKMKKKQDEMEAQEKAQKAMKSLLRKQKKVEKEKEKIKEGENQEKVEE